MKSLFSRVRALFAKALHLPRLVVRGNVPRLHFAGKVWYPLISGGADVTIDRTDSGALIPEDVAKTIIQDVPKASASLSVFRTVPMSQKIQRMPVLSAIPAAYWVNGDTGLKKTDKQVWANKYITAEEMAVIIPIPEAVLDDSAYDVWAEVKPRIVEAFGQKLDAAIFFGDDAPASFPQSLAEGASDAGNELERGSIPDQDLSVDIEGEGGVMQLVEGDGFAADFFAAAKTFKASLRGLRATTGERIYQAPIGELPTLSAEPIYFVDNGSWDADEADLITGDRAQCIIGLRSDIAYKILDQAVITDDEGAVVYNFAQQDMVGLRATFRVGFQVGNPVTRMNTDDETRFPFAVLRPSGFVGSGS